MKKKIFSNVLVVLLLASTFLLSGCDNNNRGQINNNKLQLNTNENKSSSLKKAPNAKIITPNFNTFSFEDKIGNKLFIYLPNEYSIDDLKIQENINIQKLSKELTNDDINNSFTFVSNGFYNIIYPENLKGKLVIIIKPIKKYTNIIAYDLNSDELSLAPYLKENDGTYQYRFDLNEDQITFAFGNQK